jgi:hypothetical protein
MLTGCKKFDKLSTRSFLIFYNFMTKNAPSTGNHTVKCAPKSFLKNHKLSLISFVLAQALGVQPTNGSIDFSTPTSTVTNTAMAAVSLLRACTLPGIFQFFTPSNIHTASNMINAGSNFIKTNTKCCPCHKACDPQLDTLYQFHTIASILAAGVTVLPAAFSVLKKVGVVTYDFFDYAGTGACMSYGLGKSLISKISKINAQNPELFKTSFIRPIRRGKEYKAPIKKLKHDHLSNI